MKIDIYGTRAKLTPTGLSVEQWKKLRAAIRHATSYKVEGHQYSQAYRKKVWDGRKHLFNSKTSAFPTGLLPDVEEVLQSFQYQYSLDDHRAFPNPKEEGFALEGVSFDFPYDYQLETSLKMVTKRSGIVKIATGGGKTVIACAVTKHLGLQTLFVVTTVELLYQVAKVFEARLGLPEGSVGLVGDGNWSPKHITVALLDTLESRLQTDPCIDLLKTTEVLFLDECHHLGSDTWFRVSQMCQASYRFGLSGTPLDRTDGANLRLIGSMGSVLVDIPNKFLVDRGIVPRASIIWDKITKPSLANHKYQSAYKLGIVENEHAHKKVVEWAQLFHERGLSTLILCEEIKHGNLLSTALWTQSDMFLPHQFINGKEDSNDRKLALEMFASKELPILIASTILDEGVDVPAIDAIILAGSKKSKIKTLQRLGRGLRGDRLIVVEFANFTNDYLLRHGLKRLQDYQQEECFPIFHSAPSAELIDKVLHSSS